MGEGQQTRAVFMYVPLPCSQFHRLHSYSHSAEDGANCDCETLTDCTKIWTVAQPPGESEDYNDETEDQLRPMRTEQQIKRKIAVTRKSRAPWQRSLETLELGRVQAAEMFYRM